MRLRYELAKPVGALKGEAMLRHDLVHARPAKLATLPGTVRIQYFPSHTRHFYPVHALSDRTRSFLSTAFFCFSQSLHVHRTADVLRKSLENSEQNFVSLQQAQMRSLGCRASDGCSLRRTARSRCHAILALMSHILHTPLSPSVFCGSVEKLLTGKVCLHARHCFSAAGSCVARSRSSRSPRSCT